MQANLSYNIPLLEITVHLNVNGWNVICNTKMCCEKKRMGTVWFEIQDSRNRIYLNHLDNPGHSILQEKFYCFEYSQTVRPVDKDKSIDFLKGKILEIVSGWSKTLNKMVEVAIDNKQE